MNNNYVKYPVSLNRFNKEIVSIDEVNKENRFDLICPICKDNYISVINHQTPHFKHKPHTNCTGSVESYIHWLAKEVFRKLNEFEIPEILIDDLPEKHRQKFQYNFNRILDSNVPDTFRTEFVKGLKKNLTESKTLLIEKVEKEIEYKSNLGNVRIDIVATVQNKEYFIEPFFSNEINKFKKNKLSLIKIPTLSLDLLNFKDIFYYYFSIDSFKKYLIDKKNKKWVYLTDDEFNKHSENYQNYLLEEVERKRPIINFHNSILDKISILEQECNSRYTKISIIRDEISEMEEEISLLNSELGIQF